MKNFQTLTRNSKRKTEKLVNKKLLNLIRKRRGKPKDGT